MKLIRILPWLLALCAGTAAAQYPDRPLKLVVPYSAGGAADAQARLVAQKLGARLGQTVVVENKPGASGTIGAANVARAPADGYTLLYDATAFAINPSLYKKLGYDSRRDFIPISLVSLTPNLLVVPANAPYQNIDDLTAAARKGDLTFGTPGQGTAQHIAAAWYAQGNKLDLTHVPYKGGAPALTDLMGGQIDMMFSNMAASYPLVKSGKLRALAVTSPQRVDALPELPTIAERGVPGYAIYEWNGVLAPAGVPADVATHIEQELRATLQDPTLRNSLQEIGAQPVGSSSAEFQTFLDEQMERSAHILAEAGIHKE
ncbi:tripartite tricarboxylate transporter substrate binding protein [Achromobacter marplatensis]|uniref:Bug family tripartite tricarboxylate transporter substrate binding protein n=1 Tax=Achromobacter marplatensis TaxID=470868 RepID=UPI0028E6B454|nr:tripartite tricarboxylate transporter substrate binding protein [Achromobacter marplatensis]